MTGRTPQLPVASGRLMFWGQARSWAKLFLNHMRQSEPPGRIDLAVLAEEAVFAASLDELRMTIEKHPASFVFAEVAATHFRELLGQIPHLRRTKPLLRVVIVCFELCERSVDEYHVLDSLFREAGATAVLATQRSLLAMIPAVLTHFANLPQQEINWQESMERRLPWRNA